jgi:hypothetical protein
VRLGRGYGLEPLEEAFAERTLLMQPVLNALGHFPIVEGRPTVDGETASWKQHGNGADNGESHRDGMLDATDVWAVKSRSTKEFSAGP